MRPPEVPAHPRESRQTAGSKRPAHSGNTRLSPLRPQAPRPACHAGGAGSSPVAPVRRKPAVYAGLRPQSLPSPPEPDAFSTPKRSALASRRSPALREGCAPGTTQTLSSPALDVAIVSHSAGRRAEPAVDSGRAEDPPASLAATFERDRHGFQASPPPPFRKRVPSATRPQRSTTSCTHQ